MENWTARVSPADHDWRSVCWSPTLSLFCAVASEVTGTKVMTSPDGVNWTAHDVPEKEWTSICWSHVLSLFCAVAAMTGNNSDTQQAMTSPDGINWTLRTTPGGGGSNDGYIWSSICWSPGRSIFFAVASYRPADFPLDTVAAKSMFSSDGINWNTWNVANGEWQSICWSPGLELFCAVSSAQCALNRVMTTPNEYTSWNYREAFQEEWQSIAWSSELDLFCAVAKSGTGNRIMTSPDGTNWTLRDSPADVAWESICWSANKSLFCAVSSSDNRVMYSSDGIEWTLDAGALDNAWQSVCWSPSLGMFSAVAGSGVGNRIMTTGVGGGGAPEVGPIGIILPWHRHILGAGNPLSLPAGFLECNGQTVADPTSPLDGIVLPDLNGDGRFLRGASVSGTEQDDALQGHRHAWDVLPGPPLERDEKRVGTGTKTLPSGAVVHVAGVTTDAVYGDARVASETRPVNMAVVWIIRIK